jgi:membrane protease YdiL (CAAX protease family)
MGSSETMMEEKARFHETALGVLLVSFALMVVAGLENSVVPWAPFYVVYAALATLIPIKWGTYRFGPIKAVPWWAWAVCPVIAILVQAINSVLMSEVYSRIVVSMGGVERLENPVIDVGAMFTALFVKTGERFHIDPKLAARLYYGFIIAWAAIGEELYFRGYVQGTLRKHHSARYAIGVATALFAVRHYMQMLLLLPKYPIFAASAWVFMAIPLGILLGYVYERTKSLWIPVAIHYLFNIIPFLVN